ncbi:PUA [Glarea lozoyensis ATCC 20868]|uniref:PUA n=1 Tax=Glarea lozoyensis (strain ATCC 20868 / MF5171) TaxID=1116229 RepID=S3DUE6_GLAL2|nr:PUA [Glarea lozoyensis ATCC 20868]EPE35586.1 PUA [Glarea lozoyensis ATCC 20868]
MTIEFWTEWHQRFWEKSLDHDGTSFGDGRGRKVMNMIYEVVYPITKPLTADSNPVKAFLQLVERMTSLQVTADQVKEVFEFVPGDGQLSKYWNSCAVRGGRTAKIDFPVPKDLNLEVGDYSIGLGLFGEPYLLIRTAWLGERNFESVEEDLIFADGGIGREQWQESRVEYWKDETDNDGTLFVMAEEILCCVKDLKLFGPNLKKNFLKNNYINQFLIPTLI